MFPVPTVAPLGLGLGGEEARQGDSVGAAAGKRTAATTASRCRSEGRGAERASRRRAGDGGDRHRKSRRVEASCRRRPDPPSPGSHSSSSARPGRYASTTSSVRFLARMGWGVQAWIRWATGYRWPSDGDSVRVERGGSKATNTLRGTRRRGLAAPELEREAAHHGRDGPGRARGASAPDPLIHGAPPS